MVGSVTPVEAPDDAAFPYHAEITVVDPTLWNAEQPYLYTLVLDTPNETITDRVGIREVHVANNQIYVNGQSIKFHGVNRHESDPVTGYAVGFEQTKKDLLMIKKHNFNAIRTSHYPDVPYFYQLCDQYGFFVIDEADNESHGASEYYCEGNESWPNHVENWNKPIADNPEFTEATVDRTRLCVERDKNRPCVIIWSMGNESAYGCTFEEALAWTKSFDPRRLTHYESAQYRSKNRKYDFSNIDMFSNMYPSLESIQEYLDNEPDKPYIMCEYSHCMGNGPGDLEDYFQFIQSHDGLVGGFLWEWCDHGIYKGKMPDGRDIYYYGGDHNEWPHDGNFCMDGLVYPDRRPHTGLLEFKNVYRPARVVKYDRESGMLMLVGIFAIPMGMSEFAKYAWFFICYSLLNAVFYTANNIAYSALTSLVTKNSAERVEMGSYRFMFAFATSLAIQSFTLLAVSALGDTAEAWRTVAIVYAIIGLIVNTLSVFSVKELPEEEFVDTTDKAEIEKDEKYGLVEAAKLLVSNKYYLMICVTYILQQIYGAMISMGTYYAAHILGDKNLFGVFSWAINIPLIIALVFTPTLVAKMHGMYKLNIGSYALATVARALVAVAGYTGTGGVKMMLLFTAIAALGQGPWQGDMNAVIASCSEYTWLTKHKRVDGTMYSCTSLGVKPGGGLGTAITGWLLAFSNYDKALAVQPESCINMLKLMYLVIPFVLDAIITFILSRMKVEEANDKIRAEMKN